MTRNKTFITHLSNNACFNVVHSDDSMHPRAHTLKHLLLDKCVINITCCLCDVQLVL